MKAFIIISTKDRLIFPEGNELPLTGKEYTLLTGIKEEDKGYPNLLIDINYKGYNNQRLCIMDLVNENKIKVVDLTKLTVSQVENLLKL